MITTYIVLFANQAKLLQSRPIKIDCSREKYYLQLASTDSTSCHVRIQRSDVKVIEKTHNVPDLSGASNDPDMSRRQ